MRLTSSSRFGMHGLVLLGIATLLVSTPAHADQSTDESIEMSAESSSGVRIDRPHTGSRPVTLDIQGGALYFGPALTVGFRVNIPLVDNGLLPNLNNAIFLSIGADLYWGRYVESGQKDRGIGFGVPVAFHWEFFFTEALSAFAEFGLNIYFPPSWVGGGDFVDNAAGWILVGVGGRWMFGEHVGLTVRLGTPYTTAALTFSF